MEDKPRAYVSIEPGIRFGQPCVKRQGISPELIADAWWNTDYSLEFIEENWPGMDREAVLVACWYMAVHSRSRIWHKRWGEWVNNPGVSSRLWRADYDNCPMPLRKGSYERN